MRERGDPNVFWFGFVWFDSIMKVWESHVAFGTQTRPFNDPLLVLYSVLGPRLDPCGAEPSLVLLSLAMVLISFYIVRQSLHWLSGQVRGTDSFHEGCGCFTCCLSLSASRKQVVNERVWSFASIVFS